MSNSAHKSNENGDDEDDGGMTDNTFNISKIWDDTHLICYLSDNQKKRWKCLWCNENYAGWHATKALIHLAKEPKMDIAPCKAYLPDEDAQTYRMLFERYMKKNFKQRQDHMLTENIYSATILI
jgi:hypothetical protein